MYLVHSLKITCIYSTKKNYLQIFANYVKVTFVYANEKKNYKQVNSKIYILYIVVLFFFFS